MTLMTQMFCGAEAFDHDLGGWDVHLRRRVIRFWGSSELLVIFTSGMFDASTFDASKNARWYNNIIIAFCGVC